MDRKTLEQLKKSAGSYHSTKNDFVKNNPDYADNIWKVVLVSVFDDMTTTGVQAFVGDYREAKAYAESKSGLYNTIIEEQTCTMYLLHHKHKDIQNLINKAITTKSLDQEINATAFSSTNLLAELNKNKKPKLKLIG